MLSEAVLQTRVARALGIKTTFRDLRGGNTVFLPPQIAVLAQGNAAVSYSTDKLTLSGGAGEAADVYGFGSPIHTIVSQLLPATGDGVGSTPITVYPLAQGAATAMGDYTPDQAATGNGVLQFRIGGVLSGNVAIETGDSIAVQCTKVTAAINGVLNMPAIAADNATDVGVNAKWLGESGNDLTLEIIDDPGTGVVWTITPMSGGGGDPSVVSALAQMGNDWDNIVINGLTWTNTQALDDIQAHGDGRWGALVHMPYFCLTGTVEPDRSVAITAGNLRKDDRVNVAARYPGGPDQPWQYAARAAVRIAGFMASNPPTDYGGQTIPNLRGGPASDQDDSDQMDLLVKAGISTSELRVGDFVMSDTVTYYHPDNEPIPGYRFVVDLVKLFNVIFNLRLEFIKQEWDGAPLVSDVTPTRNPRAKKPKMARGVISTIVDNLALEAILTNPEQIKETIQAAINSTNPKRLDMKLTVQLSGNTNIKSIDLDFGFAFGS